MNIQAKIEGRLDTIERRLNRPEISGRIEEEIRDDLKQVYQRYAKLEQPRALERVVKAHLASAIESDRDEPPCTCTDQLCPIRNGKLPPTRTSDILTETDSMKKRLESWERDHTGDPVALREGFEKYANQYAEILTNISRIRGKIGRAIRVANGDGEDSLSATDSPASNPTGGVGQTATDGGQTLAIDAIKTAEYDVPLSHEGEQMTVTIGPPQFEKLIAEDDPLGVIETVAAVKAIETAADTREFLAENELAVEPLVEDR